jgi:DNA modification methylase
MTPWKRKEVIGDCTLLLGDCMEIMPALGKVDAVVTDPPYGISINKSNRLSVSRGFGGQTWDEQPADMSWLVPMGVPAIVWGGNYFDLPAHRAPLVWDKNNAGRDFADFEMAWTNLDIVARRFVMRPMNMDGGKLHPTQKPEELMKWCLSFLSEGITVMDPFMGSGSTGVACVKTGRSFIGIEQHEPYFDIAVERIRKAYAQPDMFVQAAKPQAVQEAMDL